MKAVVAPPAPGTVAAAVSDLRRARRRRRLGESTWGDLAYRAYTTSLAALVAVVFLSGLVGDERLSPASVDRLADRGPAWAGLAVAAALLVGFRSGARGGPLAMEAPDVHHLLLGPVDRRRTLRRPAIGVLGYGALGGALAGGLAGSLVDQRVGGAAAPWVLAGATAGAATMALSLSAAVLTGGRAVPRPLALGAGWALLAWAAAALAVPEVPPAPTDAVGAVAMWPLDVPPASIVAVAVAAVAPFAALAAVGGLSVEAARRRTALVGQLRFAVTQQDLRTVVLLRRQLAAERPRRRPWFGALPRPVAARFPVLARDLRSIARWPVVRVARVVVLGALAGLALRGVWAGTTPLFLAAGLALWVAALDAAEGMSQEVDHPGRWQSLPRPDGQVLVAHLAAPVLVVLVVGGVALGTAWAVDPDPTVWRVGLLALVPGALCAVAGATVTVVSDATSAGDATMFTPEVAGPRLLFRTVWPPLVAVLGLVPVVAAAAAARAGDDPVPVALAVGGVVLVLPALVALWARHREDLHRALAEATGGGSR